MDIVNKTYNALHNLRLEIKDEELREKIEDIALELDTDFNPVDFVDKENALEILNAVLDHLPQNFKVIEIQDIQTETELEEHLEELQADLKIQLWKWTV